MLLWNAPAMAFPALLTEAGVCDAARKGPAAGGAGKHHHHHAGMDMSMQLAGAGMPVADCLAQHACCRFNREPAKESNAYAIASGSAENEGADVTSSPRSARPPAALPDYRRAVFDLKTDLRI